MNDRIPEQRRVERRHQRRALPAGRHVAAPEIRDDGDIGAFRDARRIVDLQRPALLRPVAHGLAMDAGRHQIVRRHAGRGTCILDRHRVEIRERIGRARGARDLVPARNLQRQQFVAQCRGKRHVRRAQRDHECARSRREFRHHGIDAIEARPGHHAGIELAAVWHLGCATLRRSGRHRAVR